MGKTSRAMAQATASLRPLPDFLIIGGIRCGTTSMIEYLGSHPDVGTPRVGEVHFFDWRFDRGERWYRSWFPMGRGLTVGESSPSYLMNPMVPERAVSMLPDARLIVLLRDPVERAISHYSLRRAKGSEWAVTLGQALDDEEARRAGSPHHPGSNGMLDAYLEQGSYAAGLRRWLDVYPADRMHVVDSARFFADSRSVYSDVLGFLGLRDHRPEFQIHNAAVKVDTDQATVDRLRDYYTAPNRALFELTGIDFRYDSVASDDR